MLSCPVAQWRPALARCDLRKRAGISHRTDNGGTETACKSRVTCLITAYVRVSSVAEVTKLIDGQVLNPAHHAPQLPSRPPSTHTPWSAPGPRLLGSAWVGGGQDGSSRARHNAPAVGDGVPSIPVPADPPPEASSCPVRAHRRTTHADRRVHVGARRRCAGGAGRRQERRPQWSRERARRSAAQPDLNDDRQREVADGIDAYVQAHRARTDGSRAAPPSGTGHVTAPDKKQDPGR